MQAKHVDQINQPTAIVELQVQNGDQQVNTLSVTTCISFSYSKILLNATRLVLTSFCSYVHFTFYSRIYGKTSSKHVVLNYYMV